MKAIMINEEQGFGVPFQEMTGMRLARERWARKFSSLFEWEKNDNGSGGGGGNGGNTAAAYVWHAILNHIRNGGNFEDIRFENSNGDFYVLDGFHWQFENGDLINSFGLEINTLSPLPAPTSSDDYRSRMSEQEKKIFDGLSFREKLAYLSNADYATKMAKSKYPNELHNGNGDAFRHALFSALNVRALGIQLAKKLGDAHETMPKVPPLETAMDLFNNQAGRDAYMYLLKNDMVNSFYREIATLYIINYLMPEGKLRILNSTGSALIPTN